MAESKGLKRLAAALRKEDPGYYLEQSYDDFYKYDSTGAIVGACALGKIGLEFFGADSVLAMMRDKTDNKSFIDDIYADAELSPEIDILHPIEQEYCRLSDAIVSLNDDYEWSFVEIAHWLEQEADHMYLLEQDLVQSALW